MTDKIRTLTKRFPWATMSLYAIACVLAAIAASECLKRVELPVPLRYGLVAAAFVPWVLWFRALLRALRRTMDELQLRVFLDALAFIPPGVIAAAVAVDVLRHCGLLADFRWTTGTLALAIAALSLLGLLVSSRRYD